MIRPLLVTLVLLAPASREARAQEDAKDSPGAPEAPAGKHAPQKHPYALAAAAGAGARAEPTERPGLTWTLVKIGLTLAAILLLIVGVGWVARRVVPGAQGLGGSGPLRVIARLPIAPRAHVYLVQVGKRLLVLGFTGDAIRTLSEIVEPGEVASLVAAAPAARVGAFPSLFRKAVGDYGPPAPTREEDLDVEKVREELKRLKD